MAAPCTRCEQHGVMLVADRSEPSTRMSIAQQSEDDRHPRFTYAYPLVETEYCYYCTKRMNKRIDASYKYSTAYETKELNRDKQLYLTR